MNPSPSPNPSARAEAKRQSGEFLAASVSTQPVGPDAARNSRTRTRSSIPVSRLMPAGDSGVAPGLKSPDCASSGFALGSSSSSAHPRPRADEAGRDRKLRGTGHLLKLALAGLLLPTLMSRCAGLPYLNEGTGQGPDGEVHARDRSCRLPAGGDYRTCSPRDRSGWDPWCRPLRPETRQEDSTAERPSVSRSGTLLCWNRSSSPLPRSEDGLRCEARCFPTPGSRVSGTRPVVTGWRGVPRAGMPGRVGSAHSSRRESGLRGPNGPGGGGLSRPDPHFGRRNLLIFSGSGPPTPYYEMPGCVPNPAPGAGAGEVARVW